MTASSATQTVDGAGAPTAELVRWALAQRGSVPAEREREAVRYFLLDHLANSLGGLQAESSRVMRAFVAERPGAIPAPGGVSLIEEYAALLAGTSAHALEFDDTHQPSSSHPGSVVFPAALAVAATEGSSFDQFASAVVAGYEAGCRVGLAATARAQYARGFHPTGTAGVFGAATAAGLLAGLDEAQLTSALGIALTVASGSMAFLADGAWTKRIHPGWAAHSGIVAARLAARGYTGPQEPVAGPDGFLHSYSGDPAPELLTAGLGVDSPAIHRTSLKAHSCCRYMQAPIDAVLDVLRTSGARAEDIEGVSVGVLEAGWALVAEPEAQKRRPQNEVDAQFSMAYGIASALRYGEVGIEQARPEALRLPELHALMDRVTCHRNPQLDALFPERWPAEVQVTLTGGQVLTSYVEYPRGDPENPLSGDELTAKFRSLTAPVLTEDGQQRILDAVAQLGAVAPGELAALIGASDILTS